MTAKINCTVREGKFVEPCETLESTIANNMGSFSNARGVTQWNFVNRKLRQPSKTYLGLRSKNHPKGILFNYCPFCGTDISSPFQPVEKGQQHDK